jgi:hypothetical protein
MKKGKAEADDAYAAWHSTRSGGSGGAAGSGENAVVDFGKSDRSGAGSTTGRSTLRRQRSHQAMWAEAEAGTLALLAGVVGTVDGIRPWLLSLCCSLEGLNIAAASLPLVSSILDRCARCEVEAVQTISEVLLGRIAVDIFEEKGAMRKELQPYAMLVTAPTTTAGTTTTATTAVPEIDFTEFMGDGDGDHPPTALNGSVLLECSEFVAAFADLGEGLLPYIRARLALAQAQAHGSGSSDGSRGTPNGTITFAVKSITDELWAAVGDMMCAAVFALDTVPLSLCRQLECDVREVQKLLREWQAADEMPRGNRTDERQPEGWATLDTVLQVLATPESSMVQVFLRCYATRRSSSSSSSSSSSRPSVVAAARLEFERIAKLKGLRKKHKRKTERLRLEAELVRCLEDDGGGDEF